MTTSPSSSSACDEDEAEKRQDCFVLGRVGGGGLVVRHTHTHTAPVVASVRRHTHTHICHRIVVDGRWFRCAKISGRYMERYVVNGLLCAARRDACAQFNVCVRSRHTPGSSRRGDSV